MGGQSSGVDKKFKFSKDSVALLIGILAIIGVVVVVLSHASSAPVALRLMGRLWTVIKSTPPMVR